MYRDETKSDIEAREAKAQKKYSEKLNWQPGYQQTRNPTKAAKEYEERQARWKYEEEYKKRLAEDKKQEEQDFIKKIASVQSDEKAFTPAELYEAGIQARKEGDGVEATMRLWQALICGDKRAAFPLFEMLRDGEGEIPKNMELAGMFLFVSRRVEDERCSGISNLENMPFDAAKAIFSICAKSRGHIVNKNKKITDEILFEVQDKADEVLDDFRLQTRAKKQPMLDVFQHPVLVVEDQKHEETPLMGDETEVGCCCIC